MKKNIVIPKSIWGKELSKSNKKERIKKYLLETIIFSIILTIIEMIVFLWNNLLDIIRFTNNKNLNIIITFIVLLLLSFLVSYIFNYFVSEYQVKKYKKKLENSI